MKWRQKNPFYLFFYQVLPIYYHLKVIHAEEEIPLKEKFDSINYLVTDQAVV
ncbi:hypothetical protein N9373_03785 [Flavobacteriaceae bacterium]|nr:hypothetical protein [Flavobacteriaceae bacterium]